MKDAELWNLAEPSEKQRLMRQISTLPKGIYDVLIKPHRFKRTLDQNSYYWVGVVAPFADWLQDEWGDKIEPEQAHEMLKQRILGVQYREIAGQPLAIPPSSRTLDVEEFSEYVEKCIQWLAEFCGIVVIPSDVFLHHSNRTRKEHSNESQ